MTDAAAPGSDALTRTGWNILVVDDDQDTHTITGLALRRRRFRGRRFDLTQARSAAEARAVLEAHAPDHFQVALVDVVMETDRAGLELCQHIRRTRPRSLRIVLRTGQPAQAPKDEVLNDYDIDYYLAKAEADHRALFAVVRAGLRASLDIASLIALQEQLSAFGRCFLEGATTTSALLGAFAPSVAFVERLHGVRALFTSAVPGGDGRLSGSVGALRGAHERQALELALGAARAKARTGGRLLDGVDHGLPEGARLLLLPLVEATTASNLGCAGLALLPHDGSLTASALEELERDLAPFLDHWRLAHTALLLLERARSRGDGRRDPGDEAAGLALLAELRERGIKLWLDGEKLRLRYPKGALTEELQGRLRANREALCSFLAQASATPSAGGVTPGITRARRGEPLPLSSAQERLWFLQRLNADSAAYNIGEAFLMRGRLDPEALRAALEALVERHEVLRTSYRLDPAGPVQVIHGDAARPLPVVDLSALPADARHAGMVQKARLLARRPFDLAAGPPLRTSLVRLDDRTHVLVVGLHHIASDGWSMCVLEQELAQLYGAHVNGQPARLPPLPIQYADYAVWQGTDEIQARVLRDLAWWQAQLEGTPVLELPLDHPRPAGWNASGGQLRFEVSPELTRKVRELGHEHDATLFMTLLAVFGTLLHRYTGQTDFAVGTPVANRTHREIEGLIGCFINTLVLRVDASGRPTFSDFLGRIRRASIGAFAHSEVPFERIVDRLGLQRDLSQSPLFQVMLVLQSGQLGATAAQYLQGAAKTGPFTGLDVSRLDLDVPSAKFDLTLFVVEAPDRLLLTIEYRADLFDARTIERLRTHLLLLLEAAVTDPSGRIGELPLLGDAERRRLLPDGDQATPFPREACVHELFTARAQRTPDATALVWMDRAVSFAELEARSNRLAHALREAGVGPDVLVALLLEREPRMVVALLATLKAGGAYLPLDPAHPPDRIGFMLEDSRARLLLTTRGLRERLPEASGVEVLELDEVDVDGSAIDPGPPRSGVAAANLAYVIYTSGSTGRPKGVMVPHDGVVNYLTWAQGAYEVTQGSGAPVHSPLGFDLTVTSLLLPLVEGRPVQLVPEGPGVEGLARALLASQDLSLVKITPAHLELLGHALEASQAAGRARTFVVGGEQLLGGQVRFWLRHAPRTTIVNEYGPTETVVGCCVYRIPPDWSGRDTDAVPIGRPIANTSLYVLDADLEPVPFGVPGELYIGGAGVTRGYLARPGLTAQRFVPDPFSGGRGARLYRSGDLVRWRDDGDLVLLGRTDDQVKLRGYRIELGEIEAALLAHDRVQQAAALLREEVSGDARLVAYVAPAPGEASGRDALAAELLAALRGTLPAYMVPSDIVVLDDLPLTRNGKLDRRALRSRAAPQRARSASGGAYLAPRTALETEMTTLWGEVLGTGPIGVRDDFFALGGHSLLAARLAGMIEQRLGQFLPIASIFEAPTIEALAARLGGGESADSGLPLVELGSRASGKAPFFCVHPLGGAVFCYRPLAGALAGERRLVALQARGLQAGELPWTAIDEMARAYAAAVRQRQPAGPCYVGGWSFGSLVAFAVAALLEADGHEVGGLILLDGASPAVLAAAEPEALDDLTFLGVLARQLMLPVSEEELRRLGFDEALKRIGQLAPGIDEAFLHRGLAVTSAHIEAARHYRPGRIGCPVTLLRCSDGGPARRNGHRHAVPEDLGWSEHATAPVAIHRVPGDHYSMLLPPHVAEVADLVGRACR